MSLDLPLIWAVILAVAVLLYVVLDGFDLGVGILFPFARSPADRDRMMSAVAPVWDGNETWLVLGGGGLFAAFPTAYAVIMPALYLPLMAMLFGLILRGVAFEFRLYGRRSGKRLWTAAFAGGSLMAAASQGLVLGGFVQGIAERDGAFVGGSFDWLSPYTLLTACGVVAGYALLGATWLIVKTEDEVHGDARRWAWRAGVAVAVLLAAVSIATLFVHPEIAARWGEVGGRIDWGRAARLAPIPVVGAAGLEIVALGLRAGAHNWPFAGALIVFLSGYLGLAADFFPYIAPYHLTFREAASADNALALILGGAAVLAPAIVAYTVFVYWLFRGKVSADAGYH
jgi:cytochrome d ubiquinol oxidase subunit II